MAQDILRRDAVERLTGLRRSTLYAKIAKSEFPRPIKLGERAVGWLESEVRAWQDARIAERDSKAA